MKNFIEKIKKNVLIKRTTTYIFIAILIALFMLLSLWLNNLNLNPIDFTKEKLYTLTEESKNKVKEVNQKININFIGIEENDSILDLANQYHNANENIVIEIATATQRPDLMRKYNLDENYFTGTIVEAQESQKSKIIASNDFYTYDQTTYEEIDLTEEKLTNAIMYVNSENVPNIYFLEGYSKFSLETNMLYFKQYVENEIINCNSLNVLVEGKIPDNCDELVIPSPSKDFDDITTNAIIDYINNGGNILWFNMLKTDNEEYQNVNKILSLYGVKPFEMGVITESDTTKMLSQYPTAIIPTLNYSEVTKNTTLVVLFNATKLNFVSSEELENLNVSKTDLLTTSNKAFFRTDFTNYNLTATNGEEMGSFIVGAMLSKKIEDNKTSKLIIYGENAFASDVEIIQGTSTPGIALYYNVQLVVDSVQALLDRQSDDLVIRKDTNTVQVTLTKSQNTIVQMVIFGVPVIIILAGIFVWIYRRRKK